MSRKSMIRPNRTALHAMDLHISKDTVEADNF